MADRTDPGPGRGNRLDLWHSSYADRAHGMRASEIRALFAVASRPEVVSLAGGMPYIAGLPMATIAEATERLLRERGAQALQYGSGQGEPELRDLIIEVMELEGVQAHPDDVVVTTGSQQAVDLVTRIFINPGDVDRRRGALLRRAPSGSSGRTRPTSSTSRWTPAASSRSRSTRPDRPAAVRSARQAALHGAELPQPGRRHPGQRAPRPNRRDRRPAQRPDPRGQPVRSAGLRRPDSARPPGAQPGRRRLPRVVLQDVRAGLPRRLGDRSARDPGTPRAGERVGDPVPVDDRSAVGLDVPELLRLARPDQGVPRDCTGSDGTRWWTPWTT